VVSQLLLVVHDSSLPNVSYDLFHWESVSRPMFMDGQCDPSIHGMTTDTALRSGSLPASAISSLHPCGDLLG
jgi:hypothetical protein